MNKSRCQNTYIYDFVTPRSTPHLKVFFSKKLKVTCNMFHCSLLAVLSYQVLELQVRLCPSAV